jgi:SPP1 gp7 family putative phage head morphogenesis protein
MSIEDKLIRRQIFIQRFSASEARRIQARLVRLYNQINNRLLREPSASLEARLVNVRRDIDFIIAQGFKELSEDINQSVLEFSESEMMFANRAQQASTRVPLTLPTIGQLTSALMDSELDAPLGPNTITMREALNDFTSKKAREIKLTIGDGVLLGDTTPQITKSIRELASGLHKNQAESLVRTLTNHAASQARKLTVLQNAELFESEEWLAVLDSRTTLICGGRDGRTYPVGRGPYPPAHWNCRSVRAPVFKSEFNIGGVKPKQKQDFDEWLRKQPASFQDEYFSQFPDGLEKAALFRRGKLPIQSFRDETGRDFTLEQLRAMEPLAFDEANIEPPI